MNLEGDKNQNIGFCLSKSIKISKHEKFPRASVIEINKYSFYTNSIRILLHCQSPNSSVITFYNRLELFLSTCDVFDLVLGDFNINIFVKDKNLRNILLEYHLVNRNPTDISGSLLDHVYIRTKAV